MQRPSRRSFAADSDRRLIHNQGQCEMQNPGRVKLLLRIVVQIVVRGADRRM